jgi:hypothetical protein
VSEQGDVCLEERWAHLRFSIVGPLLSAPPRSGELESAIQALASKRWHHQATDELLVCDDRALVLPGAG